MRTALLQTLRARTLHPTHHALAAYPLHLRSVASAWRTLPDSAINTGHLRRHVRVLQRGACWRHMRACMRYPWTAIQARMAAVG